VIFPWCCVNNVSLLRQRLELELRITTQGDRHPSSMALIQSSITGKVALGDCILAPSCQPLPQTKAGPRTGEPTADPKSIASAAHPSHPSPSIKGQTSRTDVLSGSPLLLSFRPQHPFPEPCDTQMQQVLFVRALSQLMCPRLRTKYHSRLHECILYYACVPQSILDSQPGVAVAVTHKLGESQAKCRPLASLPNPKSPSEGCLNATIKKSML
jgi:hypothetical protein